MWKPENVINGYKTVIPADEAEVCVYNSAGTNGMAITNAELKKGTFGKGTKIMGDWLIYRPHRGYLFTYADFKNPKIYSSVVEARKSVKYLHDKTIRLIHLKHFAGAYPIDNLNVELEIKSYNAWHDYLYNNHKGYEYVESVTESCFVGAITRSGELMRAPYNTTLEKWYCELSEVL